MSDHGDLTMFMARSNYANRMERNYGADGLTPDADHFTLLRRAYWRMSEEEFGAPEINGKRPYGNSDVETDLEELLPHLSEQDRLRVHCELPAVLTWLCKNAAGHYGGGK